MRPDKTHGRDCANGAPSAAFVTAADLRTRGETYIKWRCGHRFAGPVNRCAEPDNMSAAIKSQDPDDFQDVPGFLSAMAMSMAKGEVIEPHSHPRGQLVFAVSGVIEATVGDRYWTVPPQRGLWIPPGVEHGSQARTDLSMRNVYVRVEDAEIELPATPTLFPVTPLLRELIVRAAELPIEDGATGASAQIVSLILNELRFVDPGGFSMRQLDEARLRRIEAELRRNPGDTRTIEEWADLAGMSARTLTRRIKSDTGLSFASWRLQIRLNEAIGRIVDGEPIAVIAYSLGYETSGSFSRMFRRVMGLSPTELRTNFNGG